jgi:hypothetical protein
MLHWLRGRVAVRLSDVDGRIREMKVIVTRDALALDNFTALYKRTGFSDKMAPTSEWAFIVE